ncbi:GntR family transcriptional regulator [Viridibacillus sp. FSL R5-0477]|uniref:GntR family transcriptional regulator n=1 Tax=Viridibacillus arenosi FSL R5-213 TaxID=1227360 RepID=W4F474_9BACL|nr:MULTISPECIES: GntR family transcriptional regulator [Viridibacillus]ETT87565.1 GntR family transcriptional regulator [Viridibacillus arenosi FSL R5-213]OMC82621.1 GntR family transcriptional regulator [Viridibacillus sp. FSL H8-0123]OMC87637.1 GntR family transcriptional regulator [Viridibacillus sp. FSL H7-0596]OMC91180.1 GntR family transcriptional regulator [Viridibacillus arenosi]
MFLQIEPQSDVPIYTQLTQQIIEGIASGQLKPGESLPSVRALAADLGVNMHTVNKSYHELEKKGMILIIPKSGAVVSGPNDLGVTNAQIQQVERMLRPVVAEGLVVGLGAQDLQQLVQKLIKNLS